MPPASDEKKRAGIRLGFVDFESDYQEGWWDGLEKACVHAEYLRFPLSKDRLIAYLRAVQDESTKARGG